MQKVYLLLRNNQQSGPYSLDEILQLNLKPFDLVWMEGRSAAWRYPCEIESLKPYVPEAPQPDLPFKPIATSILDETQQVQQPVPIPVNVSKKIFVSLPGKMLAATDINANERKAEIKRTEPGNIATAKESLQTTSEERPLHTNYSRSLHEVEDDYTNWVVKQKTKKKTKISRKDILVVCGVLSIVLLGYFIFSSPSVISTSPNQQQAVKVENQPPESAPVNEEIQNVNSEPEINVSPNEQLNTTGATEKIRKNKVTTSTNNLPANHQVKTDDVPISSVPEEEVAVLEKNQTLENKETSQPKQEKKKLGEVLKGIFSKKDKKPAADPVDEEPVPANNRQSTRRSTQDQTAGSAIDFATLSSMIDISSNEPDNWMMGITGLKISLRNNNDQSLQTASVTVFYYDNNNQLLDKKLVYFNNVAAHSAKTVAAPDHKFADHVSWKLTSATAREDRYATR